MKRLGYALLCCFVVSFSLKANAEDEKEPTVDEAKIAFVSGLGLYEKGQFEDAVLEFRRANELSPTWKLFYNIGQCEAALKHYGLAFEAFEKYVLEGGDDVAPERQTEVQSEIDRLRKLSGELALKGPEEAIVTVNGMERGILPLAGVIRVAGGTHSVIVIKGDDVLLNRKVKMSVGGTVSLSVEKDVVLSDESQDEDTVDEDEAGSPLKVAGWISAGTGAALLIAGAVTGGMAIKANTQVEDDFPDGCYGECHNDLDRRDNLALATDIMISVGAAAVIAGTVMVIVAGRNNDESSEVAMRPILSPNTGGAVVEWRF